MCTTLRGETGLELIRERAVMGAALAGRKQGRQQLLLDGKEEEEVRGAAGGLGSSSAVVGV